MGHSCKDGGKVAPRQFPPPPRGGSSCKDGGNVAPRLLPSPRGGGGPITAPFVGDEASRSPLRFVALRGHSSRSNPPR